MKIGLIADIHSNIEALQAVQTAGQAEGITTWWVAGDVIGYGPRPVETLRLFKEMMGQPGSAWVIGNNDAIWLGILSRDAAREDSLKAQDLNEEALQNDVNLRTWFQEQASQPERFQGITLSLGKTACLMRHTFDENLSRYIKPVDGEYIIQTYVWPLMDTRLPICESRLFLFGHSHYPTLYQGDQAVWVEYNHAYSLMKSSVSVINPGGLGQGRDGDPRAAFAVLDDESQTITFRRLKYLNSAVTRDLYHLGYPVSLIQQIAEAPMAWPDLRSDYIQFLKERVMR